MSYEELSLLNAVIAKRDFSFLVRNGLDDKALWHDQAKAYEFIRSHVDQYGETPSVESVVKACPTFEPTDVVESMETLAAKVHDQHVKVEERRILEEAAKKYATSGGHELLRYLEEELAALRMSVNARTGVGATNWSRDTTIRLAEYEKRANGEYGTAIPLFWSEIDDAVGGFHRGDYVNIIAWTKKGKSWTSLLAGLHANRAGYKVLAELAESTKFEATTRLDTLEFGLSNRALYTGGLGDSTFYAKKLDELRSAGRPDYIVKTPEDWPLGLSIAQIEADIDQYRPDIVIIDQFSLLRFPNAERAAKEDTSKALKLMFARKGVIGIVVTQANGSYGKREQGAKDEDDDILELNPPSESDYSQTIATIQDATHVIAFDSVQWNDNGKDRGKAKMVVRISRTGGAGTEVDLMWLPNDGQIRPHEPQDVF